MATTSSFGLRNTGSTELMLQAFLAPKFAPSILSGREPFNQKALLHVVMCGSAPLARVNTRIATPA